MNFLLKIVEGPMKGAEIALVAGTRLRVGRGDDCDIVLADASLDALAFELDVTESGVTLVRATGEMVAMRPFEVQEFGTTAIALGPSEGAWEPLVKPQPPEAETAPAAPEPPPASATPAEESAETPKKRRGCRGALVVFLLLLGLLVAALWFLWGKNVDWAHFDWAKEQARLQERFQGKAAHAPPAAVEETAQARAARSAKAAADLKDLAAKNGLVFEEKAGVRLLKGNLTRRTERLALRALALAADPAVRFDLTDDETLKTAANETLFSCSDGAIKVVAASNRVVKLEGFAPSPSALDAVLRALNADVKGIEKLDTANVAVGGLAPAAVAATPFVVQNGIATAATSARRSARPAKGAAASGRDYPIAGILTEPFPCVIMRDGSRLTEGAQIGAATLVKISADHLTLSEGGRTIDWRP